MAKIPFTAGKVAGHKCPPTKAQAFLWDATAPGLGLRVTPAGKPAYVFQGVYKGQDVRVTIGSPDAWSIPNAQAKARELQRLIDEGHDPRTPKREALAADSKRVEEVAAAQAAALADQENAIASAITVQEVWNDYVEARRDHWGERHYQDHLEKARAGGEAAQRGTRGRGHTVPGPLFALMQLPLSALDAPTVEQWAATEAKTRPTSARLAWRLLKVFLGWCAEQPEYAPLMPATNVAKTRRSREVLGKAGVKQDALQRDQLAVWFDAVRKVPQPQVAAYLQILLLTGGRPGEVLALRWQDLNAKWKGITIRDKVEGERVIPLTPYVAKLLHALPRRNGFVFASLGPDAMGALSEGSMSMPHKALASACVVAGIEGLTLHGLRRSFKSLSEWIEVPVGVVAQIMGHKPSATAEKHYTVRPLDLLRLHHEKIEAWVLEQAGVPFVASTQPGTLRVVVS